MHVLYVAGPVRNPSLYERHQNILRGEHLAMHLWKMGFAVICPHKNTEFIDGVIADDQILAGDFEIIRRCDAIVLLPGWEASVGTLAEREYAFEHGVPVFMWESLHDRSALQLLAKGEFDLAQHSKWQKDKDTTIERWYD